MRNYGQLAVVLLCLLVLAGCSSTPPFQPGQIVLDARTAQNALANAAAKVGCAYLYGGQGPGDFDCSGLAVWSYRQAYPALRLYDGVGVYDDASADILWRFNVERIATAVLRPGDLVFISSDAERVTHVGLFSRWLSTDTMEIIDASSYYGRVVVEPWPVSGIKRGQWLVGVGRMKTVISAQE